MNVDLKVDQLISMARQAEANMVDRLYQGNPWDELRAELKELVAFSERAKKPLTEIAIRVPFQFNDDGRVRWVCPHCHQAWGDLEKENHAPGCVFPVARLATGKVLGSQAERHSK